MTRFSLVVPTLRRPDTLEHTLETLCAQGEDGVEIVVQNNGNDPATREVVESIGDPRIRHFSSDEILPMTENWQRALSNATGDILTFVGDDDGLLPDACRIAASVLEGTNDEILSWHPFLYLWPDYWNAHRRNRVEGAVSFDFTVREVDAGRLLERVYGFDSDYSNLPMAYNSFVKRSLIDRVRARHGEYFFGSLPDLASGIVNAAFCSTFLKADRALSITGLSHHSIGSRLHHADARLSPAEIARDFPYLASSDENGAQSTILDFAIAREMEALKDVIGERRRVALNPRGVVRAMAAAINDSPSRYEETIAAIRQLTQKFGIDPSEISIPPRTTQPTAPSLGAHVVGPNEVLFVIDGHEVGLDSIAGAVRLMSAIVPRAETMVRHADPGLGEIPTVTHDPLPLARNTEGERALISGWSDPESWGTWSVDREASFRFRVVDGGPKLRVGIRYRLIPRPDGGSRRVECSVGGRFVRRWDLSGEDSRGELAIEVPEDVARAETVELKLVNPKVWSPMEMGIGADTRPLGIGVEQIRLLGED